MSDEQTSNQQALSPAGEETAVIIVTRKDWEQTLDCLRHVHAQTSPPRRIIVCENGSGNHVADRLITGWRTLSGKEPVEIFAGDTSSAPLVLLRLEENLGFAGGINAALNMLLYDAAIKAFWVLHNDTRPAPYALAALLRHSVDAPGIGLVGSTMLLPSDLLQCAGGGRISALGYARPLDEGVVRFALSDRKDIVERLQYISGASFLLTREAVEKTGLFTEVFFLFFAEAEYCRRAVSAGFRLNWAPGAVVYHVRPDDNFTPMLALTDEPELTPASDYINVRNRFYMLRLFRPATLPWAFVALPFTRRFWQRGRPWLMLRAAIHGAGKRMDVKIAGM